MIYKGDRTLWKELFNAKIVNMRHIALALLLSQLFILPAQAQEITAQPICFTVRNTADHKIYGEFRTDYVTDDDGQKIHHSGSFRLEAAGTTHPEKDYPLDRSEFCSSGPFFPGRQLELVLRTMFPVFSCKTNIESGEIVIHSKKQKKDGVEITKMWATCL